jgi:catechol 2,3-dioxygenase-like lactoylglutathione lyase family enzyme
VIDHIGINVSDVARSKRFYEAALAPLGYKVRMEFPEGAGFGDERAVFWIILRPPVTASAHVAFSGKTRQVVRDFHAAALKAGGKDNGAPGVRENYSPSYYGAFVLDPDGNNVEVVCLSPEK